MRQLLLFTSISCLMLVNACVKDKCTKVLTYTQFEPVYLSLDEVRVDPVMQVPRALSQPGKIYLYGSTLMINELNEGIHFYDNADPTNPQPLGFLNIPGNNEMAVLSNTLYADNYSDLLAIDITDISNVRLKNRTEDVYSSFESDPERGLLVRYDSKEVTEEVDCDFHPNDQAIMTGFGGMNFNASASSSTNESRQLVGLGGSMARFAINAANLYVVDQTSLQVFDLSIPDNPQSVYQAWVGMNIETIFPYGNQLFIGSSNGMFIYDITDPHEPVYRSVFEHAEVCDPVFVDGQFAYVTLRSGTACNGFMNQLDILDVSNLSQPILISSTPMDNPHGLSVFDNTLFLCEGASGLKVFDVQNKLTGPLQTLFRDPSFFAYDAIKIPNQDVLIVVGEDGFYQYDIQNPSGLTLLSRIEVQL
jgi:hypothetical protein